MKFIFSRGVGYALLKLAIVLFTLGTVLAHCFYWYLIVTDGVLPYSLQLGYSELENVVADSVLDFVITTLFVSALVISLWYALQLVLQLEATQINYSYIIKYLARFATALCCFSVSMVLGMTVVATIDHYTQTNEFKVVVLINMVQMSLLLVSIVLFLVGKALRLADEAVKENQTFL